MYQPTFASVKFEQKKRKTRRERFLERLDALVPWEGLEARIEPHYPKAGRGRRPYPLSGATPGVSCIRLFFEAPELIEAFTALERQLASPEGDTLVLEPVRRVPRRRR